MKGKGITVGESYKDKRGKSVKVINDLGEVSSGFPIVGMYEDGEVETFTEEGVYFGEGVISKYDLNLIKEVWKQGMLVKSRLDGTIVILDKDIEGPEDTFSGSVIWKGNSIYDVGYYCDIWNFGAFKLAPVDSEVILKNNK